MWKRAMAASAIVLGAAALITYVRVWGKGDDFWQIALPGYLTGVGTLTLAAITYLLMRQEVRDRRELAKAQHLVRNEAALAEARKVIALFQSRQSADYLPIEFWYEVVSVVNTGNEPILDVRLVEAASRDYPENMGQLHWEPGSGGSYLPFILQGATGDFGGNWARYVGDGSDQQSEVEHNVCNADRSGLEATITWTDSRGQYWLRSGREVPVRLQEAWTWGSEVAARDDTSP